MIPEDLEVELENIRQRLQGTSKEQKIDAILEALQHGDEGIELVSQALNDSAREVRQSAFLFLLDIDRAITKQAMCSHFPVAKSRCLHILTDFDLGHYSMTDAICCCFAIVDHNDTLFCWWNGKDGFSPVNIWDLKTGHRKMSFELFNADELGLGKQGKVFIQTYQHLMMAFNTETQSHIHSENERYIKVIEPSNRCFAVCPTKQTLAAIGRSQFGTVEIEIWDYDNRICLIQHQLQGVKFAPHRVFGRAPEPGRWCESNSPLLFTPDGKFLIVHLHTVLDEVNPKWRSKMTGTRLQIWDLERGEVIQTVDSSSVMTIDSLAIIAKGEIVACGVRENTICVWELRNDKVLYTFSGIPPCLMSSDGRFLVYCTNRNEIVIYDLALDKILRTLEGHAATIGSIALSSDREFIASYSFDGSIRIWGLLESIE
jgi:WD40 repeat protein